MNRYLSISSSEAGVLTVVDLSAQVKLWEVDGGPELLGDRLLDVLESR